MPRWRLTIEEQYIFRQTSWIMLTAASQVEAEALLDGIIAAQEGAGIDPVTLTEAAAWAQAVPAMEERAHEWALERTDLLAVQRLADPTPADLQDAPIQQDLPWGPARVAPNPHHPPGAATRGRPGGPEPCLTP